MKTLFTHLLTSSYRQQLRRGLFTLVSGLVLSPAWAQTSPSVGFPRNETFKGNSASNFDFGGTARLTGVGGSGNDAVGAGYLRLTDAATFQAGYVIDNVGFSSLSGFTISFEFFSYGGDGADGFSVFLVDADQPSTGFRIGATGGALGYAQRTIAPAAPGVSNGYIGIGIDEFGNYSNNLEGRVGGFSPITGSNSLIPNAISIRGAGNGSSDTDYAYLTGTGPNALGFPLDVTTARAQSGTADYRRAFIDVVANGSAPNQTYKITVRIQHGNSVRTAVENFTVTTPPERLRLGFAGSTGGNTNIHEIRNLNIVQVPYANNDTVTTNYNSSAVTLDVLSNDEAPGSQINPASVDLDPGTDGIQNTFEVDGKGSFSVDTQGIVSFTPTGTFAGVVEIPYTVQSLLGADYTSSPATITVTVRGADVATTLSGPSSALPNTRVTYSMSTQNRGTLPAYDVVPQLQLPKDLSAADVQIPAGSLYDPATGLVTFASISTLPSGAAAVINAASFLLPDQQPPTLMLKAVSTSSVPDPILSDNTASLTTNIGAPLPVEMTSFNVRADHNDAQLTWTTASEKDNAWFELERSQDGTHFGQVGRVAGQGTTAQKAAYSYRDAQAGRLGTGPLYYRLRQVDSNGEAKYSVVQTVQFAAPTKAPAVALYPNPASGRATLDLTQLPAGEYTVQVLDLAGRLLRQHKLQGAQLQPLDVQTLQPGAYLVRVQGPATSLVLPLTHY